jgi:tetrahydromethanopterin S-methyltransferase subunit G
MEKEMSDKPTWSTTEEQIKRVVYIAIHETGVIQRLDDLDRELHKRLDDLEEKIALMLAKVTN